MVISISCVFCTPILKEVEREGRGEREERKEREEREERKEREEREEREREGVRGGREKGETIVKGRGVTEKTRTPGLGFRV